MYDNSFMDFTKPSPNIRFWLFKSMMKPKTVFYFINLANILSKNKPVILILSILILPSSFVTKSWSRKTVVLPLCRTSRKALLYLLIEIVFEILVDVCFKNEYTDCSQFNLMNSYHSMYIEFDKILCTFY